MGTNYYLKSGPPCETCGRVYPDLHIGKSSGGWVFALHAIPEEGINDLPDWVERWSRPGSVIEDEYGREVSKDEMYLIITNRFWKGTPSDFDYYGNLAVPGPNNLARSDEDRLESVRHGSGTWDIHQGKFS